VPYLIDGNNLMHALAKAGGSASRVGLCRLLEKLTAGGQRVRVVFDGPARAGSPTPQDEPANPAITYASIPIRPGNGSGSSASMRRMDDPLARSLVHRPAHDRTVAGARVAKKHMPDYCSSLPRTASASSSAR